MTASSCNDVFSNRTTQGSGRVGRGCLAELDFSERCMYAYSIVPDVATLVRESRERAGLSVRALAQHAEVAASTVSRIEAGKVSPTVETLQSLMHACGRELELKTASAGPSLATLRDAWTSTKTGETRPDFTRLRSFLDSLAADPDKRWPSVVEAPEPSGSEVMDNLLAGIAETVAETAGHRPPAWTKEIEPLSSPWFMRSTPRKMAARQAQTPRCLAERGLVVDAASLWRDPVTVV